MNKSEIHLFIIWQKGRYKETEILNDIAQHFTLLKKFAITWTPELVSNNFTRFYGVNLPSNSYKEQECGIGEFLLCVVRDENPIYEIRITSRGPEKVNINMFDAKEHYRTWTGGGHKIHGTNNEKETNHDLTLLIGKNIEDFLSRYTNSSICIKLQKDIEGARGWNSLEHLFYILNNTVSYVILRGFMESSSPPLFYVDTDFITTDYENFRMVVNGIPALSEIRPKSEIHIGKKMYYLDVWDSRKNYFDPSWLQDMLATAEVRDGMRVLNDENDFYCLLYHCLTNKGYFDEKYAEKLTAYKKKFTIKEDNWAKVLVEWMSAHNYDITKHIDSSNGFNISNPIIQEYVNRRGVCIRAVKLTQYDVLTYKSLCWESRVYEKENSYVKRGTPWLIDNEKLCLSQINLPFVPFLIAEGTDGDLAWIEISKMPGMNLDTYLLQRSHYSLKDLRKIVYSCVRNVYDIYQSGLMHRDITPDNIIVYNDNNHIECYIIDFGSAIMFRNDKSFPCPPGLGKNYAPTYMYSDFYSCGMVMLSICRKMPFLKRISKELMTIQWDNYGDEKQINQIIHNVYILCNKPFSLRDYYAFYRKKYSAWRQYIEDPRLMFRRILKRCRLIS